MDGNETKYGPGRFCYDEFDMCWWNTTFKIPRGCVVDSELQFDARTLHITNLSAWKLKFYLNDEVICSIDTYKLKQDCEGSWKTFTIPQQYWINETNIFSNPVNNSEIRLNITFEYLSCTGWWDNPLADYQQLFIDNVKIITKAEAIPKQLDLKMNQSEVIGEDWGKGTVKIDGPWQAAEIYCNFTSDDAWNLSSYDIEFKTDLHLFIIKESPETNYETNYNSIGISYSTSNSSIVDCEGYAYISIPNEYRQMEMRINYPKDVNITWISSPQYPGTNQLYQCNDSTPGLLIVPIYNISSTPAGYWKLQGISANYLENLNIFKNGTNDPNNNVWNSENTFLSGDYINITAKISNTSLISEYINETKATLYIKFPNQTIWTLQNQFKSPDANGFIFFDYFQIPEAPPHYKVGVYEAIIIWNNSYSTFGLNESGIMCKKFTVIHNSILTPERALYEDVFEGTIINLKVSFNDFSNFKSIQNATVYLDNFTGGRETFTETNPGCYLLEFNTSRGNSGVNNLTIYANSSSYVNKEVNITIELMLPTILVAKEFPSLQVQWNENFTINLNYTEKSSGNGIISNPINNWIGDNHYMMISPGVFNLTFNTSAYEVNKFHLLIFSLNISGYEAQSLVINIQIIERDTSINKIFLNGLDRTLNKSIDLLIGTPLNITLKYIDISNSLFIENVTVQLIGESHIVPLTENKSLEQYSIILNTDILKTGINFLTIYAQKDYYTSSSELIIINLDSIRGEINTESQESVINIKQGERYKLKIVLNNLDFGGRITDAVVKYYWEFGSGELEDSDNDGIYEVILENIPQGAFIITITAIAGDNYQFESVDITVNVHSDEGLILWIIIILLIITAGVTSIGIALVKRSKKELREVKAELMGLKKQRDEITEEDILLSKEQHICLVHKGPIEGFLFICECGAYYCDRCVDAIKELENTCWSCGKPLDPFRPSLSPKEKETKSEEETRDSHKKGPRK